MMVHFQGLPQINTLPRLTLPGAHVSDLHSLVFLTGNPPRSPVLADGPILALGVLDTHGLQMPPSLDCRCCCSVSGVCFGFGFCGFSWSAAPSKLSDRGSFLSRCRGFLTLWGFVVVSLFLFGLGGFQ